MGSGMSGRANMEAKGTNAATKAKTATSAAALPPSATAFVPRDLNS
jgi:hypothetical protein